MAEKAIIVHDLEQAHAALAAAGELGVAATLASPPGASAYLGAGWFREMIALAREAHPAVEAEVIMDCGDKAGHVLEALRMGFTRVRFTGTARVAAKLSSIAGQSGAALLRGRLRALDLRGAGDPAAACRDWLAAGRKRG